MKMLKIGSFVGKNDVIGRNLGKEAKNLFLKVSKNYFSQVYGHKLGEKLYNEPCKLRKLINHGLYPFRTIGTRVTLDRENVIV